MFGLGDFFFAADGVPALCKSIQKKNVPGDLFGFENILDQPALGNEWRTQFLRTNEQCYN